MAAKTLKVFFVSSKDQVVDIPTKPLSIVQFNLLHSCLTIFLVPVRARGAIETIAQILLIILLKTKSQPPLVALHTCWFRTR